MKALSGSDAKAARMERGASQAAVSAALGINRTYYSLFESERYSLTDEQQAKLSAFLELATDDDPASDPEPDDDDPASPASPANPNNSARLASASTALENIEDLADATGLDSKRTAAAVGAALSILEGLDYDELRELDDADHSVLDGMPSSEEFGELQTLALKQDWELKLSSALICVALYGDEWLACECKQLRAAEVALREALNEGRELGIRAEPFFGDKKSDQPKIRCELAPHIVRAAQDRQAPRLGDPSAKGSVGFF